MPSFNADRFRGIAAARGHSTYDAIAQHTGLDISVVYRLLNGQRQPSIATLTTVADAYDTPLDDLILRKAAA